MRGKAKIPYFERGDKAKTTVGVAGAYVEGVLA